MDHNIKFDGRKKGGERDEKVAVEVQNGGRTNKRRSTSTKETKDVLR